MPEITATWEVEIRRIVAEDHSKQKIHKTQLNKQAGCSGFAHNSA
jgi:hypothetical protein